MGPLEGFLVVGNFQFYDASHYLFLIRTSKYNYVSISYQQK